MNRARSSLLALAAVAPLALGCAEVASSIDPELNVWGRWSVLHTGPPDPGRTCDAFFQTLPVRADGRVDCRLELVPPAGSSCADLEGARPQIIDGVHRLEAEDPPVCELLQLTPASRTLGSPAPTGPGWFYDDFTAGGSAECVTGTPERPRIVIEPDPPVGTLLRLECFQPVGDGPDGDVVLGTRCEPGGELCSRGTSPNGGALTCDRVTAVCAAACVTNEDCDAAGVDFWCDDRALGLVDSARFTADPTPRGTCAR